jgi:hypothetical protein
VNFEVVLDTSGSSERKCKSNIKVGLRIFSKLFCNEASPNIDKPKEKTGT